MSHNQQDAKPGFSLSQSQYQATDDSDKLSLIKEPPPPARDAKSASSIHIEEQLDTPSDQHQQRHTESQNQDQDQSPQRQNQQRNQEPKPLKRRSKLLFFLTCHSYNRSELLEKPPAPRRSEPSRTFRARQRLPSIGGKSSTSATAESRSVAKTKNQDVNSTHSHEDKAQQAQQSSQVVENGSDHTATAVDSTGTDGNKDGRKSTEQDGSASKEPIPNSTTTTTTTTNDNANANANASVTDIDSDSAVQSKEIPAVEHTSANTQDSSVNSSQSDAADSRLITSAAADAAPATASATAAPISRDIDDVVLGDSTANEANVEESSKSNAPAPGDNDEVEEVDDETARALDEAVTSPTPHIPAETEIEQQQQQHQPQPQPSVSVVEPLPTPATEIIAEERKPSLLPPLQPRFKDRKCLVLDLDETLVHSSLKPMDHPDFMIPVEIEGQNHNIYVIKRPHVDEFMKRVGELYEVVIFTASVSKVCLSFFFI